MVNELTWKMGRRSAVLVRDALRKHYRLAAIDLNQEDANQLMRLVVELDELISSTPIKWVKVEVLAGDNKSEGES
jgi:hypothetical protein